MKAKTMAQLVADLRHRSEELESRAGHLRQTADFLSKEYGLDGEAGEQTTSPAPTEVKKPSDPKKPSEPKLFLLRCSGSADRPDCTTMVKSVRKRTGAKCEECKRLESIARSRKLRARKKAQGGGDEPKTRRVWKGGEGLSRSGGSAISPESLSKAGA